MSIFPKKKIKAGDLVIGAKISDFQLLKTGLDRFFIEPCLVLEIKESQALVFFEQSGPEWYDINKLERVYGTEEYTGTGLAGD